MISAAVDPAIAALDHLPADLAWQVRAGMLVTGVALNALATALYVGAGLGPGPRDGLMTGLVRRTGLSIRVVRTTIEVVVVGAGWLLGGRVGVGTALYALAIGPLVHAWLPALTVRAGTRAGLSPEAARRVPPPV